MTQAQDDKINQIARRFGCADDFLVDEQPFDLPPSWVSVIMGKYKGRLRSFAVSPTGEVASPPGGGLHQGASPCLVAPDPSCVA